MEEIRKEFYETLYNHGYRYLSHDKHGEWFQNKSNILIYADDYGIFLFEKWGDKLLRRIGMNYDNVDWNFIENLGKY